MGEAIAFIGFGEAGAAFAGGAPATGYDRKTDDKATRPAKLAEFASAGVQACLEPAEAVSGARWVLSLVTADQALAAARAAAPHLRPGTGWIDMNSVAPSTKREAAAVIEAAGGRYVDAAVMAPVHPRRRATPILLAAGVAREAAEVLAGAGFSAVEVVDGPVGTASAIKMIRSVLVKGMEAVTAECFLAAEAAGVTQQVAASLERDWPGTDWRARADYNLERMLVHGLRRAAEMDEVARTLDALGTGSTMARAAAARQRELGGLGLTPPAGLQAKAAAIATSGEEKAT